MKQVSKTRQERRRRERSLKKGAVSNAGIVGSRERAKKSIAPLVFSALFGMIVALMGAKLFLIKSKPDTTRPDVDIAEGGNHEILERQDLCPPSCSFSRACSRFRLGGTQSFVWNRSTGNRKRGYCKVPESA